MHGLNPIRPLTRDSQNLAINSMFYTIQGEGPYSGMPALFIRLAGCNLACVFCDTEFERNVDKPKNLDQIMGELLTTYTPDQRRFVVLTGGEPLRQPLADLITCLLQSGTRAVQIETAGTLWQPELELFIRCGHLTLVCSPKTPKLAPGILEHCHHWKYVLQAGRVSHVDGLPNMGTQRNILNKIQEIARPPGYLRDGLQVMQYCRTGDTIWVSPCDEGRTTSTGGSNTQLVGQVAMRHGYRVSLQIHKYLGLE